MLVRIGSYDICDGTISGGVAIGQARIQIDRSYEVTIAIDQLNPAVFNRTCHKVTFTFTVQRSWSSIAAAEVFLLGLDVALPGSGNVTLFPTNSVTPIYIPAGQVTTHQTQNMGAMTTTTYTIIGGQPSLTP